MTDDTCGAPTGDGTACQNPTTPDDDPARCWIPTHNDIEYDNPQGRPSKFNAERARDAIEAAKQSKSKGGCARAARVDRATLHRWLQKNPEFPTAVVCPECGWKTDAAGAPDSCPHCSDEEHSVEVTPTDYREFRTAFTDARADGETLLVQGGLRNDEVDSSFAKFLLKTSFDYQEVQHHEMRVDDDADVADPDTDTKHDIVALIEDEPDT